MKNDSTWKWQSHLVKIQAKNKDRHAKNRYDYIVHGEVNLKLNKSSLNEDIRENVQISLTKLFSSKHLEELHQGPILYRET